MTINVVTYHSINAKPDQAWSGCCILPSGQRLEIWFCGPSEDWVIARARAFYEREKARQDRLYGSTRDAADNDEDDEPVHAASGRGAHFVGKVWMIHNETRQKVRVLQAEVASYVAQGYVKGGPRSK